METKEQIPINEVITSMEKVSALWQEYSIAAQTIKLAEKSSNMHSCALNARRRQAKIIKEARQILNHE